MQFRKLILGALLAYTPLLSASGPIGYIAGDVNADGVTNISDPLDLLGYLFLGAREPNCLAAGSQDDGQLGPYIGDAIAILEALFGSGSFKGPYPYCGPLFSQRSCRKPFCEGGPILILTSDFYKNPWDVARPTHLSPDGQQILMTHHFEGNIGIVDSTSVPSAGKLRLTGERVWLGPYVLLDEGNGFSYADPHGISNTGVITGVVDRQVFISQSGIGYEFLSEKDGTPIAAGSPIGITADGTQILLSGWSGIWKWVKGEGSTLIIEREFNNLLSLDVEVFNNDATVLGGDARPDREVDFSTAAIFANQSGKWQVRFPKDENRMPILGTVRALSQDQATSKGVIIDYDMRVYPLDTWAGDAGEAKLVGQIGRRWSTDIDPIEIAGVAIAGDTPFLALNRGFGGQVRTYLWTPEHERDVALDSLFGGGINPLLIPFGHRVINHRNTSGLEIVAQSLA